MKDIAARARNRFVLNFNLIETSFDTFANRADPDQAALDLGLLCLLMEI